MCTELSGRGADQPSVHIREAGCFSIWSTTEIEWKGTLCGLHQVWWQENWTTFIHHHMSIWYGYFHMWWCVYFC